MIKIQNNIDEVIKNLNNIGKKQIPFAMSRAMNDTAVRAQTNIQSYVSGNFNNRKKWYTKSNRATGIRVMFSTKTRLRAKVYTNAYFAALQEKGGIKTARGGKLAVPTTKAPARLRRSDGVRRLLQQPRTFANKKGAYRRMGRGGKTLRKIFSFVPSARVKPRLRFVPIAKTTVKRHFIRFFKKRLREAIQTAK